VNDALFAATREQAARVAGVTVRQLDYWTAHGLVVPDVDTRLSPHRPIRLYSFLEVMALVVAAELRRRSVSLQHIRAIVSRVKGAGYEHPLTQLVWASHAGRLYFMHPDGSWEGHSHPGQGILREVLDLDEVRVRIRDSVRRNEDQVGRIERRRNTKGSKPVVAGTRVPVETVERYLAAGRSYEQIVQSFPALQTRDVEGIARTASA